IASGGDREYALLYPGAGKRWNSALQVVGIQRQFEEWPAKRYRFEAGAESRLHGTRGHNIAAGSLPVPSDRVGQCPPRCAEAADINCPAATAPRFYVIRTAGFPEPAARQPGHGATDDVDQWRIQ